MSGSEQVETSGAVACATFAGCAEKMKLVGASATPVLMTLAVWKRGRLCGTPRQMEVVSTKLTRSLLQHGFPRSQRSTGQNKNTDTSSGQHHLPVFSPTPTPCLSTERRSRRRSLHSLRGRMFRTRAFVPCQRPHLLSAASICTRRTQACGSTTSAGGTAWRASSHRPVTMRHTLAILSKRRDEQPENVSHTVPS